MSDQKRTIEELLQRMSENNKKVPIAKLACDEQGRLLLDPTNPHHVEWWEEDQAAELIPDNYK